MSASALLEEANTLQASPVYARFLQHVAEPRVSKILDVGGRDRSKVDRSRQFPEKSVTVVDILPGENVDVVGDAHEISGLLPREDFDAFMSISVFEHLLMPWKAALEINAVLKPGAVGIVHTHQCIGMHDMPWDFLRFSDTAWDGIFNKFTGFEILTRSMTHLSFIIPFIYRPEKSTAEKSAGYESSTVLVRKIGEPAVRWDVPMSEVTGTMYPDHDDGFVPR